MKLNWSASLGMLLSLSLTQSVFAAELRPENFESLIPADQISSMELSDFDLDDTASAIDAMARPSHPGHGNPGHGGPGHGNPGHGYPGHGNPGHGYPGHGNPGHGHPGHGYPGHGYYPPGGYAIRCFAEDNYGNWYSAVGDRYNSGYVQRQALYSCRQSGNSCWTRGCRAY